MVLDDGKVFFDQTYVTTVNLYTIFPMLTNIQYLTRRQYCNEWNITTISTSEKNKNSRQEMFKTLPNDYYIERRYEILSYSEK